MKTFRPIAELCIIILAATLGLATLCAVETAVDSMLAEPAHTRIST